MKSSFVVAQFEDQLFSVPVRIGKVLQTGGQGKDSVEFLKYQ